MTRKVFAKIDLTGTLDSLINNINEVIALGATSLFILSAEKNSYDIDRLNLFLQSLTVPIAGGVFPKIIIEDTVSDLGSIVCGSNLDVSIHTIFGLNSKNTNYDKIFSAIASEVARYKSIIVLVDSTCLYITNFLEVLYQYTGKNTTYLGGGAGSLSLQPAPCIYTNKGLVNECAQIVCLAVDSIVCVQHGWEKMCGPYIITGCHDNTIDTIDFVPAFEVYSSEIEKNQPIKITKDNLFDIAKNYPIGIEKIDGSIIVRDPISTNNKFGLNCVGDIIENSIAYILKGNKTKLIEAAKVAAEMLGNRAGGKQEQFMPILLFDCITRQLYLDEKFSDELSEFKLNQSLKNLPLIGATTIGEIASYGMLSLEYFNKTLVAGLILKESSCNT